MKDKLINTHDKFFKELFSKKKEVTEFIEKTIPIAIVSKLDLNTLELDSTEYIDEQLKQNFSDIVYNCQYGKEATIKLSFLFEHKSYPEKHPHFQILDYMLSIWKLQLKQKQKLTPIVPIIFYHGKQKWKKLDFEKYFLNFDEDLLKYIPSFNYELIDITQFSDVEIQQIYSNIELKTSLLLLKNIFSDTFFEKLSTIFAEIDQLFYTEEGEKFVEKVSTYIFYNSIVKFDNVIDKMKTISPQTSTKVETIAMQLLSRGREEGRLEGRQEAREEYQKELVILLIKEGMDNMFIHRLTQLSEIQITEMRESTSIS